MEKWQDLNTNQRQFPIPFFSPLHPRVMGHKLCPLNITTIVPVISAVPPATLNFAISCYLCTTRIPPFCSPPRIPLDIHLQRENQSWILHNICQECAFSKLLLRLMFLHRIPYLLENTTIEVSVHRQEVSRAGHNSSSPSSTLDGSRWHFVFCTDEQDHFRQDFCPAQNLHPLIGLEVGRPDRLKTSFWRPELRVFGL